jgi:hypothetical protein
MTTNAVPSRKAVASLSLLVLWEIWNERNARVFYNKHVPHAVILKKRVKPACGLPRAQNTLGRFCRESNPFVSTV